MSLPPLNPEKTAAGIVIDPRTLERVVPSSKRKDGTVRKEQKIRPGFTPQEDVGVFRSARQASTAPSRSVVPGSNNRPGSKAQEAKAENPFAQVPEEAKEKTKAQLKNEKRREKRREKVSLSWDDDDDDDDEDGGAGAGDMREAFKAVDQQRSTPAASAQGQGAEQDFPPLGGSGGAPAHSVLDDVKATDAEPTPSVTEAITAPPPGPETASSQPANATLGAAPNAINTAQKPSIIADRAAELNRSSNGNGVATSSSSVSAAKPTSESKPHPIQGGRKGPLGLAHPPPIEEPKPRSPAPPSKADTESWRSAQKEQFEKTQSQQSQQQRQQRGSKAQRPPGSAQSQSRSAKSSQPPAKPAPAPRERKEVKVREGGANDIGSLASRVRNLVIANTAGNAREKRSTTPKAEE